jgi:NTE family protein
MGADIIIGVDVGFKSYSKDELTSIFKILEQSLSFYSDDLHARNKEACDIIITPDLRKYNASSFNSADSIIASGERAARAVLPEFKRLADSLNLNRHEKISFNRLPALDSILLREIQITGLKKVSSKLVLGKLQLIPMEKITASDIEEAINRVYSSLYFENVSYEIEPFDEGIRLRIILKENKGGLFRVGIHYDSYTKSAILLNTTFRNLVLNGSKLSMSAALGEYPFFMAYILKNNGWKPGFGFNFEAINTPMFLYRNSEKISTLHYSETRFQFFTQSIIRNSYSMGLGIELENALTKPVIDPGLEIEKSRDFFTNYYGFLNFDSYDHAHYPSKGIKLHSELKLITSAKIYSPVIFLASQLSVAQKISDRVNLIARITGGAVEGDTIPTQYMFYTGGQIENMRKGIVPFTGLDYMERVNRNALVGGLDLQVRFWKNIFLILRGNAGNLTDNFNDLLSFDNPLAGFGATLGYNSLIGPIEVSVSKAVDQNGTLGFFRIGFYF